MQYVDVDSINLRKVANSFGLNLSTFLSLPKEYRDALIHGGFVMNKGNVINNSVNNKEILKKKVLLLFKNNK